MNIKSNKVVYYLLLVLIVGFSAYYYMPCFYAMFNSDMAIHVLMTKDFQLPRDFYYWGQNRLGSLLPMVSHVVYTIFKVHPLYIISVVQYLFLLIPYLIISQHIKSIWLRLVFACLIFLPFNSYNALLYIGHPYSQQFFCGTVFIALLGLTNKMLIENGHYQIGWRQLTKVILALVTSILFFVLGIWVSEFNAILAVIPLYFIAKNYKIYLKSALNKQVLILAIIGTCTLLVGYKWYNYTKEVSVIDKQYDKLFITSKKKIAKEFNFMIDKIRDSFDYSNSDKTFENTIYILFICLIVFLIIKRKEIKSNNNVSFSMALILTAVLSSILLFFSVWNYRSEFSPRYFIPVFIMVSMAVILYFDKVKHNFLQLLFFGLIAFHCFIYSYNSLIKFDNGSTMKAYSDFADLPEGTIIADYWEAYLINSIAIDSLQSLSYDNQTVRNFDWRNQPLSSKRFYFLNNENAKNHQLSDTIVQFNTTMVSSQKRYLLKQGEVLEYQKIK